MNKDVDRLPEYEQLFEQTFNFAAYIDERLREIDNLDERRFAREILSHCLLQGIEQAEEKYKRLEKRVYDEIECQDTQFAVCTAIVSRDKFDPISDYLYPICPDDLPPDAYDTEKLLSQMESEGVMQVARAFFPLDHTACTALLDRHFHGKLMIEGKEEFSGVFRLKPDRRYLDSIEQLYCLYSNNGISWTTVNTAYISKCFFVELEKLEKELTPEDKVIGFSVDFEEYADVVCYNWLPLWNIERLFVESASLMLPCIDSIGWEHTVSIESFGVENEYLVDVTESIRSFRREQDDIVILTDGQKLPALVIYKIARPKAEPPTGIRYPILTNEKHDHFIRRLAEHCNRSVLTKAALLQKIHELKIGEFLIFEDVSFAFSLPEGQLTYSMNPFVNDEIVDKLSKKLLLFRFRPKNPGYFINQDMLSFVISQLQLGFNEYRCEGVLL